MLWKIDVPNFYTIEEEHTQGATAERIATRAPNQRVVSIKRSFSNTGWIWQTSKELEPSRFIIAFLRLY